MSLSPGTRIGVYEITAPLGAGGMGEVYRAKDADLHAGSSLDEKSRIRPARPSA